MNTLLLRSFLDCITCALGGVLLLLFTALNESRDTVDQLHVQIEQQQAEVRMVDELRVSRDLAVIEQNRIRTENDGLRVRISVADSTIKRHEMQAEQAANDNLHLSEELRVAQGIAAELTRQNEQLAARNEALGKLQQTQAREVIGLHGDCKRLAFVVDTSSSMEPYFAESKTLLGLWVQRLDFESFNIIRFADAVTLWKNNWQTGSDSNRNAAAQHAATFQANGATATRAALLQALALPEIDTMVFFSDGAPSDGDFEEILTEVRKANQRNVVINVIALGNYFEENYGTFLRTLAEQHGGQFLGR